MKTFKFFIGFSFALFLFGSFTSHVSYAEENPCLVCHVSFKQALKNVHNPVNMGCDACHVRAEGKEHPRDKDSMKLTQEMPHLCYVCHEESKFKGKVVHSPVAGGMCTSCHDAHQSNVPKILKKASPELCYMCHDKGKFTKKFVHSAIPSVGCGTCHAPHVSNNPSLLASDINELCLSCHVAKAKGTHVVALPGGKRHPIKGVIDPSTRKMIKVQDPKKPGREIEGPDPNVPGKELTCVSCHDPHSADFKSLLTAQRICLKCHKY